MLILNPKSGWCHKMEAFSALLALCVGNSPVTGEFPSQRPVTRSFHVSLICAWTNSWVNNREAGDLRRHRAHYDVTVMTKLRNCYSSLVYAPFLREDANIVKLHGRDFILAYPPKVRQHRTKTASRRLHKTVCMQASTCMGHMDGHGVRLVLWWPKCVKIFWKSLKPNGINQSHATSDFECIGKCRHGGGSCTEFLSCLISLNIEIGLPRWESDICINMDMAWDTLIL